MFKYDSGVSVEYGLSKKLTLTLKDSNNATLSGKTVKIVFSDVTYTKTTDDQGQAVLVISNILAAKTYPTKIIFDGDSEYLKSSKDVKVVVNKAKSKITAYKKTFKKSFKTKKYTIALKANNKAIMKVKVTLKVKGKTYKATTNSKGKATVKIKNLNKKGKFTTYIKFAGNRNYKSTSKKVIITVK